MVRPLHPHPGRVSAGGGGWGGVWGLGTGEGGRVGGAALGYEAARAFDCAQWPARGRLAVCVSGWLRCAPLWQGHPQAKALPCRSVLHTMWWFSTSQSLGLGPPS